MIKSSTSSSHINIFVSICFLSVLLSARSYHLDPPPIVLSEASQIHIIASDYFQTFKIPSSPNLAVGNFDISIVSVESQVIFHSIVNLRVCNEELDSHELALEEIFYIQGQSMISFNGNSSDNYCFDVKVLLNSDDKVSISHRISKTFTQMTEVLEVDSSFEFNLEDGVEKTFAYNLSGNYANLLHISITPVQNEFLDNFRTSDLELRYPQGVCVQSHSSVLKSWLCDPSSNLGKLMQFSLQNKASSPGSYNISISKISPQRLAPNSQKLSHSFIPGFGGLYKVSLHLFGVLQIQAKSKTGDRLPIITANKISKLFEELSEKSAESTKYNINTSEGSLMVQNDQTNAHWYIFIQGSNNLRNFELKSHFMPKLTVGDNAENLYYIDPEKDAYQHIQLKFEKLSPIEKYEIVLEAKEPNSLRSFSIQNLNPFSHEFSVFSEKSYFTELFSEQSNINKLSTSFTVDQSNSSLYLTIHASKKDLFLLQLTKVKSKSIKDFMEILKYIAPFIVLIYVLILKFLLADRSKISNGTSNLPMTPGAQSSINIDIEANTPQEIEIVSNSLQNLREKTKEKKKTLSETLTRLMKLKQHQKTENLKESRCDICYESKDPVIFYPCNHACACAFCASIIIQTSLKCPLCREKIKDIQTNDSSNQIGKHFDQ